MPPKQKPGTEKVSEMDKLDLEELISKATKAATGPLLKAVNNLTAEVSKLKNEIEARDQKIANLERKVEDLEQYGRRNNLRIFGVKEKSTEDTNQIVIDVAQRMNVDLNVSCIDRSHRVGKKNTGQSSRPIIVKFTSYAYREKMFRSKKALKNTGITVREDLTQHRLELLKKTVDGYKMKRVWTSDGVIVVNVGIRFPARVRNHEELEELLTKYPPEQFEEED